MNVDSNVSEDEKSVKSSSTYLDKDGKETMLIELKKPIYSVDRKQMATTIRCVGEGMGVEEVAENAIWVDNPEYSNEEKEAESELNNNSAKKAEGLLKEIEKRKFSVPKGLPSLTPSSLGLKKPCFNRSTYKPPRYTSVSQTTLVPMNAEAESEVADLPQLQLASKLDPKPCLPESIRKEFQNHPIISDEEPDPATLFEHCRQLQIHHELAVKLRPHSEFFSSELNLFGHSQDMLVAGISPIYMEKIRHLDLQLVASIKQVTGQFNNRVKTRYASRPAQAEVVNNVTTMQVDEPKVAPTDAQTQVVLTGKKEANSSKAETPA